MDFRDFFVTPLIIMLVLAAAYLIRPRVTDPLTRRYFFPALILKICGAIAIGLVYQFYYGYGDTLNFHKYGSRHIWETFGDSVWAGLRLIFGDPNGPGLYGYNSKLILVNDPSSFLIIRISAFFDLFTFSSYAGTAVLFSVLGFIGAWMFYLVFYDQYPHLHKSLAICFFLPSLIFWGSGLLKDTITLACIGASVYCVYYLFIKFKFSISKLLLLIICLYTLFIVRAFMLQVLLPSLIIWIFLKNVGRIRSIILRLFMFPIIIALAAFLSYQAVLNSVKTNSKYAIQNIANTAMRTAYDIRYWTGRDAGSGYSLGELDGSFGSMVRLAPQAVNVSLFRPYVWEVRNPLMALSALESLGFLLTVLYLIFWHGRRLLRAIRDADIIFCSVFVVAFAFAVGVATYNFGSLARYKIPLLPFFVVALVLIFNYEKKDKNAAVLDRTE